MEKFYFKKLKIALLFIVGSLGLKAQTPVWNFSFTNSTSQNDVGGEHLLGIDHGSFARTTDRFGETNALDISNYKAYRMAGSGIGINDFTISFWVKTSQSFATVISHEGVETNDISDVYGYRFEIFQGAMRFYSTIGTSSGSNVYTALNGASNILVSSVNIANDEWHLITVTGEKLPNSSNQHGFKYKLYVDGQFDVEAEKKVSLGLGYGDHRLTSTSSEFKIAENRTNSLDDNFKFSGGIDEILLYNSTLSDVQVLQLYDLNQRAPKLIYVNALANGNETGESWGNAFTNLQDALDEASQIGDTVFVSSGTYTPGATGETVDQNSAFTIKRGVNVYGGFAGTESSLIYRDLGSNETILSGDFNGDDQNVDFDESSRSENAYNVIIPGKNVTIDGFTISDGSAILSDNATKRAGAAIVRIHSTETSNDTLTIRNCIIKNNLAWAQGAGVYCDFKPGSSTNESNALIIENCEFANNVSTVGAAISIANRSEGTSYFNQENCLYHSNRVEDDTDRDGLSGSAIFLFSISSQGTLDATFTNITIAQNESNGSGAAIAAPIAYRVNDALATLNVAVRNSIITTANNESTFGLQSNSINQKMNDLTLEHVRVTESTFNDVSENPTSNNLTSDTPVFTNAPNGDFSLTATNSGLINTGNNSFVNTTIDLAGNSRIISGTVDLGAYEYDITSSTQKINADERFTIFPNPAIDIINTEAGNVSIYDIHGKLILNEYSSGLLDISSLNSGMYFIRVNGKKSSFQVR